MASWVTCLQIEHEDQSLDPRTQVKLDTVVCVCNLTVPRSRWLEGRDRKISEEILPQIKQNVRTMTSICVLHMCVSILICMHICVHMHKDKIKLLCINSLMTSHDLRLKPIIFARSHTVLLISPECLRALSSSFLSLHHNHLGIQCPKGSMLQFEF